MKIHPVGAEMRGGRTNERTNERTKKQTNGRTDRHTMTLIFAFGHSVEASAFQVQTPYIINTKTVIVKMDTTVYV
jgi:hypothetical protein